MDDAETGLPAQRFNYGAVEMMDHGGRKILGTVIRHDCDGGEIMFADARGVIYGPRDVAWRPLGWLREPPFPGRAS